MEPLRKQPGQSSSTNTTASTPHNILNNNVVSTNPEDSASSNSNKIKIKVKSSSDHTSAVSGSDDVVLFKVKTTTKLDRLMEAYCNRVGLPRRACRFIFDGEIIKNDATPESLEMEEDD